jgi:hypothetical protein
MTNPIAPQGGAAIDATILSLAHVGGTRRPVKIVEHPAFRNHPRRTDTLRTSTVPRIPMSMRVGPLSIELTSNHPMDLGTPPAQVCCVAA